MKIIRKIGKHEILVDTSEAVGIYLHEDLLKYVSKNSDSSIDKKVLLKFLSNDEYLPLTLHWEIIDKCNFACPFCYIVGHSFNKLQRFEDIQNHLKDLIDKGLLFCLLSGGEPTVHPDFKKIYRFLKENGVIVEILSNGLNLDDSMIKLFKELPPSMIEISLYSIDNKKLCNQYGVSDPNAATKILNNINKLNIEGINIKCKTFSNTITDDDIKKIIKWCKINDIDYYTYSDVKDGYDGTPKKMYQSNEIYKTTSKEKTIYDSHICLPCNAKKYGLYIDSSFSASICATIQLKDFTENILAIGINKSLDNLKNFMTKFQDTKIIGNCKNGSKCATCIAYAIPVRNDFGEIIYFRHPID